ncbi:MAG: beta-ketoacyl-[acyl-carrier-protein] synthase family protein [Planctomycetota bacterium]|nr:beta-ketoacyl-[acyl-carrier-protein] synthase family protein [Planctomycetota bacterium]
MRRVVVTGLGIVTPLGCDIDAAWKRLLAGERGVAAPQRLGPHGPPTRAVGEIAPEVVAALRAEAAEGAGPDAARLVDPRTLFALAASRRALAHAGLEAGNHPRAGVMLGAGPGASRIEDVARCLDADGRFDAVRFAGQLKDLEQESILRAPAEQPAACVASRYGIGGPVHAVTTACSASNQALGMAWRSVRSGETDWVLAGGSDSQINPLGMVFFVLLGASAQVDDDDPASACRPFDRRRSGLVMGEGAGVVVLESLDHARARGATILAEVAGYGASLDAFRTTAPPPDGRGAEEAMRYALEDGAVSPADVAFVNAHGTGTKRNDPAEITAIKAVLGEHAATVAVSSSKGAFGHLLSAAAGVAFCCCVKAVQEDAVPPTANLEHPDRGCDVDLVPGRGRALPVRAALNNSFAFGGQNACIVVKKYTAEEDA